jgi:hypothetical protein
MACAALRVLSVCFNINKQLWNLSQSTTWLLHANYAPARCTGTTSTSLTRTSRLSGAVSAQLPDTYGQVILCVSAMHSACDEDSELVGLQSSPHILIS